MKKLLIVAIVTPLFTSPALAEYSSTVSLFSEYQVRGIGYSGGEPSIGASFDWWNDTGLFAGIYGYTSDSAAPNSGIYEDNISIELDGYLGYGGEIENGLRYSATAYYYTFPGSVDNTGGNGWDYPEIGFNLGYGNLDVWYFYSWEFSNTHIDNHYIALAWNQPLPHDMNLKLQSGYSFGEYQEQDFVGSDDDYIDYEIALSRTFNDFTFTASYVGTDIDGPQRNAEYLGVGNRFIFGVSRTF